MNQNTEDTGPSAFEISASFSALMTALGRADAGPPGPGFKTAAELADMYSRSVPWAHAMLASLHKRKIPVESKPVIVHNPVTGSRRRAIAYRCQFWAEAPASVAPSNGGLPDPVE